MAKETIQKVKLEMNGTCYGWSIVFLIASFIAAFFVGGVGFAVFFGIMAIAIQIYGLAG